MKCLLYYTDGETYELKGNDIFVFEVAPNNVCFELTLEGKIIDKCIKEVTTKRIYVPRDLLLGYRLGGMEGTDRTYEVVAFSDKLKIKMGRKDK